MNNTRRKSISKIKEQLENLMSELETIRDEEQEAYDNMPESIQEGEKGEKSQNAIDALQDAMSDLEEIDQYLETAME